MDKERIRLLPIWAIGRVFPKTVEFDAIYLRMLYRAKMGKKLNLDNPQTLNEKLQWLKLYDRKPVYTQMVDKYEVRNLIAEKVGEEYLVPLLGVWDNFEEIDFDLLPDQFVLKCTHDSGGLCVCSDKKKFDIDKARKKINHCMRRNYYTNSREWPYKNVKPRIIAEKYMVDESGWELKDYKIFCFNGKAEYVEVDFNRYVEHKLNPYDFDWNPLNFCDKSKNDYSANIPKPKRLEDMREIAEKLSADMDFLRVDFYSIEDKIYIGELTLCPGSGCIAFNPKDRDLYYGQKLKLSCKV
jgi:hypothetical protein